MGYYFQSPFHNSLHFLMEIQLLLKVGETCICPSLMASHFSKAMSPCWLEEAVFGSRATMQRCYTSYLSGQRCKPGDDPWRVCVPNPMVSVVTLQSRALTAGACAALLLYMQKHMPDYILHIISVVLWCTWRLVVCCVTDSEKYHSQWQAVGSN